MSFQFRSKKISEFAIFLDRKISAFGQEIPREIFSKVTTSLVERKGQQ